MIRSYHIKWWSLMKVFFHLRGKHKMLLQCPRTKKGLSIYPSTLSLILGQALSSNPWTSSYQRKVCLVQGKIKRSSCTKLKILTIQCLKYQMTSKAMIIHSHKYPFREESCTIKISRKQWNSTKIRKENLECQQIFTRASS